MRYEGIRKRLMFWIWKPSNLEDIPYHLRSQLCWPVDGPWTRRRSEVTVTFQPRRPNAIFREKVLVRCLGCGRVPIWDIMGPGNQNILAENDWRILATVKLWWFYRFDKKVFILLNHNRSMCQISESRPMPLSQSAAADTCGLIKGLLIAFYPLLAILMET